MLVITLNGVLFFFGIFCLYYALEIFVKKFFVIASATDVAFFYVVTFHLTVLSIWLNNLILSW